MSRLPHAAGAALASAGLNAAEGPARGRPGERVHAVRVACKRLRSYWRALKAASGAGVARRRRRELSRVARFLAVPRERDALRALAREFSRSDRELAVPLSAFLRRLPPPPPPGSLNRKLDLAASELEASARSLALAALPARRSELRKGLKALKRRLEKARDRAERGGRGAGLHACRKRAKDLLHLLEAFGGAPSSVRELRKSGRDLGLARDLRTLAARARLRGGKLEKMAGRLEDAALARLARDALS
jgi:CHAD domain-containing protein